MSVAILGGQALLAKAVTQGTVLGPFAPLGEFASFYTGFDFNTRQFDASKLLIGYGPWIAKRFIMPLVRGSIRMPRGIPISIS